MSKVLQYVFEITLNRGYTVDPVDNVFVHKFLETINAEAHLQLDMPMAVRCRFLHPESGTVLADWGVSGLRRHPITKSDCPPASLLGDVMYEQADTTSQRNTLTN